MAAELSDRFKEILFTPEEVDAKIEEMAATLVEMFKDKDKEKILFVELLNGAQAFASKLMFAIDRLDPSFKPNLQAMIISRYGESRDGSEIRVVTDLPPDYRDLTGYDVVILDDLIDEGVTLEFGRELLLGYGSQSVESVVLVKKNKRTKTVGKVALFGFETEDVWLTGMGMDNSSIEGAEANRWYGGIAIPRD